MSKDIINKAKEYAINCHRSTNHLYDNKPYEVHLQMVVDNAQSFIHLIPENERDEVLAGSWVHDVSEDCRENYNDVKKRTNTNVAELVFALTNEKGKTRKERANKKYYRGIVATKRATFIKLCDRIANVQYSKNINSSMYEKYKKENEEFIFGLNYIVFKPDFINDIIYSYCNIKTIKILSKILPTKKNKYKEMFDKLENLLK